jgi:cell division protein ZapA
MSEAALARVSVRILEKEYQFACAVDERAALLDSAEYLNSEMKKIRDSGKVIGLDRIAVMAALNMANELLKNRSRDTSLEGDVVHRVRLLRERVEATLERGQQLEL